MDLQVLAKAAVDGQWGVILGALGPDEIHTEKAPTHDAWVTMARFGSQLVYVLDGTDGEGKISRAETGDPVTAHETFLHHVEQSRRATVASTLLHEAHNRASAVLRGEEPQITIPDPSDPVWQQQGPREA